MVFIVMNKIQKKRFFQHFFNTLAYWVALKLSSFIKLSYIVGSSAAFFSATNILYSLGGCFLGTSGTCLWFVFSFFIRLLAGMPLYFHLIHGIPGFCAALYMATPHILIRLILPLACMILFIVHPVGFYAAPYAFYWLIPIALYFVKQKQKSLFTDALGASFVSHAVGSVFWLYLVPMPVTYWWLLIPVVAIERLSFATGAVLLYSLSMYSLRMFKKIKINVSTSFLKCKAND